MPPLSSGASPPPYHARLHVTPLITGSRDQPSCLRMWRFIVRMCTVRKKRGMSAKKLAFGTTQEKMNNQAPWETLQWRGELKDCSKSKAIPGIPAERFMGFLSHVPALNPTQWLCSFCFSECLLTSHFPLWVTYYCILLWIMHTFFAQIFDGKIRVHIIHGYYYFCNYIKVFNSFIYAYALKV